MVKNKYFISDNPDSNRVYPYGTLILTKIPPKSFQFFKIPTNMNRKLLIGNFIINNKKFEIATMHLESLNNAKLRKKQIKIISKILNKENSILTGDLNFDSEYFCRIISIEIIIIKILYY